MTETVAAVLTVPLLVGVLLLPTSVSLPEPPPNRVCGYGSLAYASGISPKSLANEIPREVNVLEQATSI